MAITKQICLLNISEVQGGICQITCAFWLPVVSAFPNASGSSAYPAISTDPNTSGVLAAIQAGTIIEEVHTYQFSNAEIVNSWAAVEAIILAFFNARKNYRSGAAAAVPDPGLKYAILYDSSTGWSA